MTAVFRHADKGVWSADASDLGLSPGFWPADLDARLDAESVHATLLTLHRNRDNEVTHAEYAAVSYETRRAREVKLYVWND